MKKRWRWDGRRQGGVLEATCKIVRRSDLAGCLGGNRGVVEGGCTGSRWLALDGWVDERMR